MNEKRKLLVQLDGDAQPSLFDRIVALDAGADELLSYGNVTLAQVQSLVHGCIFTRGPKSLARTAIFIGGSQVAHAEALLTEAQRHLIPPFGLSVSLMLDANGCNTTAAAAIHCANRHGILADSQILVLGAGPVGQRIAYLLARLNAQVILADPESGRAIATCKQIAERVPQARVQPFPLAADGSNLQHAMNPQWVFAAGPAGKCVLPATVRAGFDLLRGVVDVNAVPPLGIEGVEVTDAGANRDGIFCYGALGIGNVKMKIHQAAIAQLFLGNQQVLDTDAIYQLAASV